LGEQPIRQMAEAKQSPQKIPYWLISTFFLLPLIP